MFDELQKIDPKLIMDFRKTGKSLSIPARVQDYITQLDKVSELYAVERNIRRTATRLNSFFPDISWSTCRDRVYEAINAFHINNTVKQEAWYNYYADYLDDLAKTCIAADNLKEARLCIIQAADYRVKASVSNINPDDLKPKDQLLSPEISPERLGIKEKNLKELWSESKKFIDKLDVDEQVKERVKTETMLNLGVTDVDFKEV